MMPFKGVLLQGVRRASTLLPASLFVMVKCAVTELCLNVKFFAEYGFCPV